MNPTFYFRFLCDCDRIGQRDSADKQENVMEALLILAVAILPSALLAAGDVVIDSVCPETNQPEEI